MHPTVQCAGCKAWMTPTVTESVADGLHRTTYRCDGCGTETERICKGDGG